jgi:hypothetical protein
MEQQFVNDALQKFAKTVISQSRANLTRGKKNVNRKLYDSLKYELNVHRQSFSLEMFMEEYGKFQDEGVNGTEVKHGSRFSFKDKQPPTQPIAEWAKARRIRFRDEKGRYLRGNYNTIGFIIARAIKKKGIKPSLFFTKPFEKHFKNLPDELVEAYGLNLDNIL